MTYGRELWRNSPVEPVNRELFERTAPAWNCVAFPGEGMHYLDQHSNCHWCGMTKEQIQAERTRNVEQEQGT